MLSEQDKENLIKSAQTANLLVMDLHELISSKNILLAELAMSIHASAAEIEQRLLRLESLTK